ncbi:zinc finger protein 462-like [Labrus bergylta]|uniref:zinc finger protein 462-like n=1 Tax=Labrus bergylta TaxID=56723 RepID=UPI0033137BBD
MQKDSVHISTSGTLTHLQAATQEPQLKSLQCSHCSLVFKSKVYLFEHLHKVHDFSVDAALTDASLKQAGTDQIKTDIKSNNSGEYFECQHCDFKAFSLDVLKEHERRCQRKPENQNLNLVISENQKCKVVLKNLAEAEGAEEIPSLNPVKSTSTTKCAPNSSKDLKTYKRPLQTITKYLVASSGIKRESPVQSDDCSMSLDGSKETLLLQESPSNSSPNSSGVFKVTAMPTIDMTERDSTRFLLDDPFPGANLKPPKLQGQLKKTVLNYVDKRPKHGSSGGPPVKKAKSDKNLPEKANASKHQSSSNKELSLEFSEGEEERNLEDMDVETSTVYNCKNCDFCAVGIRPLSAHYQNSHPHIRYNAVYLKDPTDQSATFRCLECPIEFSNDAELKRHCIENHPEALRALTMQSHGHSLVFKCFVCSFTTDTLKALKEHYKEKHPTHEVDNSLMYCRYSASRYQEEDESRLVECQKVPSPERTEDISAESVHVPCNKVRKTPLPQHPNSIEADITLYHCNNCKFSHKSLIVMHVHYQRSHPDEAVTIDTIKQSASVSSHTKLQMTSDKSPDSVIEKSTPTKSTTDSETTKHKNKLPLKRLKLCLRTPMRTQEASKTHSESPKSTKVESAEDRSKGTVSPTTQDTEKSYDLDSLSVGNSPEKLFYCQRCCYSSTNIKSVLGHHNTKHSVHERTDIIEIALYSTEMQKRKQIQLSPNSIPADSEVCEQVGVCDGTEHQHMEENSTKKSVVESNAYAHPENLFYCQKCNLGNPTIKGVLNHQNKAHRNIKTKRECIIKHTALIRDQIQKSKSQENGSASHLPLPVLNEGETDVFFCHFCNYRHRFLKEVLRHYATRHPRFKVKDERIRRYSSLIHEKMKKSPENQEVTHESLGAKEEKKIKTKEGSKVSESPSTTASQIQRTLKCRVCQYKTQHVYLLRRHLKQIHRASRTVTEVLRMCYKQGAIPAGYHCDMCVFSHQTAKAIYEHYKEKHKKQPSLEFVSTRLHVGPKSAQSNGKEQQIEGTDILIDGDVTDDSLSPQRSRPNENRVYSCKACSFKSHSMSNITQHYRAVHPWSVKEDGSVLDVIDSRKPGGNRQVEDPSDVPVALDKYQVPLEFDNSPGTPNKVAKSSKKIINYCPAKFHSQLRLDTHIGLKHRESETETENSNDHGEEQIQTSFHLFSCPHCPYVNTIYHGALNHCQMKHPGAESSAGSFLVDGDDLKKLRDCLKRKGPGVRVSGYMCKTCPQIYATLEKVERHFRKFTHGNVVKAVPTKLKPPPKLSAVMKQTKAKLRSNKGFMSKAPFFKNKQLMVKCHHCAYKCTTKLGLGRHVLLSHSNASAAKTNDPPYKCALCSNAYFRKKLLGTHYANKHGKESLVKYFAPLNKQVDKTPKPAMADCSLTQHQQNNVKANKQRTTTEENKIWMFKCPYCTYVNASYFGILTHCQMSHPGSTARADDLHVEEILVTDMVGFSKGKSPNVRGYRCKRCPQIHVSMKKLKTHCERDHGTTETTSSKLVLTIKKTQKQQDYSFQQSVLEAFSLKNDTSAVSIIETDRSPQLDAPEIGEANTTSVQNKEMPYECHICSYKGSFRRYLQSHYRKCHKIDALTTHKLLQKYNKRTHKTEDQLEARPEETATVECKMCPNVMFDSPELLIAHFRTAHNSDRILDFIILSRGSKRTTGLYKCLHCKKQLNGISKMCYHMDRHRERENMKSKDAKMETSDVIMTISEDRSVEQGELPVVETLEELEWDGAPVEIMTLPTSPLSSPTKPTDQEQPEEDSRDDLPTCKQCGRTFMSVKGLRSHERSHAAFAAIKKHTLPASVPRHKINKYIIYKSGTTKPFVCSFCSYRTNVMGLWRRHFMKSHQDILEDPTDAEDQDEGSAQSDVEPNPSEEWSDIPTHDEKPEMNKRSLYSEPPNVQQQLNQYNLMAQVGASSKVTMKVTRLTNSSVLYCELCDFNTEHLSSIRRHYSNRHGKKLHKCKDCEFFTCSRKTLKMHMDRGHSACPSEPTHQKDICCPFCLYQTKNKNHMIDHIILHREERLVPIEVRRPKLSRYLRGMVFRCHNCTFTCGNAENLHLHMMKHDSVKPYKCRLCFFDCAQLSDLEAHLSDKHQVIRNHELVGQVSLDQLEARGRRTPGDEEELLDDSERHNKETIKTEEIGTDYDEVQQEMQAKNPGENEMMEIMTFKIEDDYQQQDMGGTKRNEEGPESLLSDLENTVDQNIGESMEFKNCKGPEKEMQTKENTARTSLRDCGDSSTRITHENKQDESLWGNVAKKSQFHIEGLQKNVCITGDSVKNNTLDENLKIHMMVDPEREIKTEQEIMYPESTIGFANNQNNRFNMEANKSQGPETTTRAQESFTFNNDLLPSVSNCAQFRISHQESLGVSLTKCNEKQMHEQHNSEQLRDQYGEMPVLKKEYLREEMDRVGCYLAGDHNYYRKQEQDKEKMIREDDTDEEHVEHDGIKDADKPHVPKGALPVTDGAAEGGCPVTTEDKRFTCELCGRNLMNSFDLQRHVLRHGI